MHEQITAFITESLANIPKPLATAIIAMLPITELRASIPIAMFQYGMSVPAAFFYSVIGNIVPITLILLLLERIRLIFSQRSAIAKRFFDWLYERTYKKDGHHFEKWGPVALVVIAALPFPIITGAWTAALLAAVFKVPFRRSAPALALGIVLAGIIIVALTLAAGNFKF